MVTQQDIPTLQAELRNDLGRRPTKRLRESGRLPAVIYGHKQAPVHVAIDGRQISDLLHHSAHLVQVSLDNATEPCLIKDVQWNYLGSEVIHVDLARVNLTEKVTVQVALEFFGDAPGLKTAGAIMEHPVTDIEIECTALQIPDHIRVNVGSLGVGESITVADLQLPEGVVAVTDGDTIVATIGVVEEVEETAAAATEPEVIGKPAADDEK